MPLLSFIYAPQASNIRLLIKTLRWQAFPPLIIRRLKMFPNLIIYQCPTGLQHPPADPGAEASGRAAAGLLP